MPASKQLKTLSVRMPEAQLRRFKAGAAARGQSLQTVVTEAVEAWLAQPVQSRDGKDAAFWSLRGFLAGPEMEAIMREDEFIEREHERHLDELAGIKPRS